MVKGVLSIPLDGPAVPAGSGLLTEFIAGPENRMVVQASDDVRRHSVAHNPLVFCGPSGSGKSFLARGLIEQRPETNTVLTTGVDFARRYANAIDTNALEDFRSWYESADVFLLDDLESIGKKQAAQFELTRAIDRLESEEKQILILCRQIPAMLHSISTRLASRLLGGLVVNFQLPETKTRRVILQELSAQLQLNLSRETINLLAGQARQNELQTVPQLRSALLEIATRHEAIDHESVAQYLSQCNQVKPPTLRTIATAVSRYFRLKISDLRGPTRQQHVVRARGVAMYLARKLTDHSLTQIGEYFEKRDHTTVLHACRKTQERLSNDLATQHAVTEILEQLEQEPLEQVAPER